MTDKYPDIRAVRPDLTTPLMNDGEPGPGRRVRQTLPEYARTAVYHALYFPPDWQAGNRYPVLIEYPGNGNYCDAHGDTCSGRVEDCNLGYGLSGGRGMIWACLPFISADNRHNQLEWWGDADATACYCRQVVEHVCSDYGGDPNAVILCGFSRGAIACNYIGLRDDDIAALWLAFFAHSHYDGVRTWPYADSDRRSAFERLKRIEGRAQFISHEMSVAPTERYLRESETDGRFTLLTVPYRNHSDAWVLRDIPERRLLRGWVRRVLARKGALGNNSKSGD